MSRYGQAYEDADSRARKTYLEYQSLVALRQRLADEWAKENGTLKEGQKVVKIAKSFAAASFWEVQSVTAHVGATIVILYRVALLLGDGQTGRVITVPDPHDFRVVDAKEES